MRPPRPGLCALTFGVVTVALEKKLLLPVPFAPELFLGVSLLLVAAFSLFLVVALVLGPPRGVVTLSGREVEFTWFAAELEGYSSAIPLRRTPAAAGVPAAAAAAAAAASAALFTIAGAPAALAAAVAGELW